MAGHRTIIRDETRFLWLASKFKSLVGQEYRIVCSCGYQEKARTDKEARERARQHEKNPHYKRSIKVNG